MAPVPSLLPKSQPFSLSVSGRVLLGTCVVWVGLLLGMHWILSQVFRPTFGLMENGLMVKDLERVEAAILRESEQLQITSSDYASWDDMRAYVQADTGEVPRALSQGMLKTLALDSIFVFDEIGRVRSSMIRAGREAGPGVREYTAVGFADHFPVIASVRTQGDGDAAGKHGLVRFSDRRLVFAASSPIWNRDKSRALGTVVMLRELDSSQVARLAAQVRLPLTMEALDPSGPAHRAKDATPTIDEHGALGHAWISDPFGKPIARFSVVREASILAQGEKTLSIAGSGSLFVLSVVLALLLLLLQLSVVRPLGKLTRGIEHIRRTSDLTERVSMHRKDEIGLLAYHFDRLLDLLSERTRVLEELATTDGLTRLLNRRSIMERLAEAIARSGSEGQALSILLLDVDHFKRINDTCGHSVGDRVLRQVAETLRTALGPGYSVGRYGGEEFLVVLPACDRWSAQQMAEKLRKAVGERPVAGVDWPVTVSLGVATWALHTTHGLLATADMNLYRAKESGRNRVIAEEIPISALPQASIPPPAFRVMG